MTLIIPILALVLLPQETFTSFSFCRESERGLYELQCVQLGPKGVGEIRFKRRNDEEVRRDLALSSFGTARFLGVLAETDYLARASEYESGRKVADLGRKTLVLESASGRREAVFNYSDFKEVNALVSFFDLMLNQEMMALDLDLAVRFERLSVPERLDQLESEMNARRIADPHRLIPVLEKIEKDTRVLNYARTHARLREALAEMK